MIPVEIQYELKDLVINKDMVLKLLQNLKTDKSPGPDSLHPRLLFEIKKSIASDHLSMTSSNCSAVDLSSMNPYCLFENNLLAFI
jgi:hypothetical protein